MSELKKYFSRKLGDYFRLKNRDVSESSIRAYAGRLLRIFTLNSASLELPLNLSFLMKDHITVTQKLEAHYSHPVVLSMLYVIWLFLDTLTADSISETQGELNSVRSKYFNIWDRKRTENAKVQSLMKKSSTQTANWIDHQLLVNFIDSEFKNLRPKLRYKKNQLLLRNLCILACCTLFPRRSATFCNMRLLEVHTTEDKMYNYFSPAENCFIFNEYKTKK